MSARKTGPLQDSGLNSTVISSVNNSGPVAEAVGGTPIVFETSAPVTLSKFFVALSKDKPHTTLAELTIRASNSATPTVITPNDVTDSTPAAELAAGSNGSVAEGVSTPTATLPHHAQHRLLVPANEGSIPMITSERMAA